MGITAENVAAQVGHHAASSRTQFAVESHQRAPKAIEDGYFKEQILPIELKSRKGTDAVRHRRARARRRHASKAWPSCKPAFKKENGTVTAGNASGINDARRRGRADGEGSRGAGAA